jgi:tetratricopeptide (TPR) repeat protein
MRPSPTIDDPVLARISDALDLYNSGRRAEAREAFNAMWAETEQGDPFHRCVLAHYMADAQDDPAEELKWDRRALEAADQIAKQRPDEPSLSVLSLYPSLHLNLADVLERTGDKAEARKHLEQARIAADSLADDSYGQMIRHGIERLAARLGA